MSKIPTEDKIRKARVQLMMHFPFFGVLVMRLRIQEEKHFLTAATDGRSLFYNADFVEKLTPAELLFVICHEVMHCANEHFIREMSRKRDIWNMATDYCINGILVRDKVGSIPKCGLYDKKYEGKPSEEIYDDLIKNNAQTKQPMDSHIYIQTGDDQLDGNNGGESKEKANDKFSLSKEEASQIRNEMREAIINAYEQQKNSDKCGGCPAEMQRMIEAFLEPVVVWQELLHNTIQSKIKTDCSFMRPSRKSWSNNFGAILPGKVPDETIKVAIAIDVSGSITANDLTEFLSEVNGMMEQYASFEIHLWCFDTKCNNYSVFTEDNKDELIDWVPTGGGGTNISANWKFLDENELDVETLVIVTDLECSSINAIDENRIDTIWIIKNTYNKNIKPPFGSYAKL